ncbi:unnamed protein product [Sphagnum jensenii]|jgi:uncharacterized cupin superfamily protein|uniref:(S)-ureidoglycine aminohydrolase cupin domain-containing protein n=1 Tax=Sphagnum jensenii TaxID=128206 RepID=A0ABP0W8P4_9BRYO
MPAMLVTQTRLQPAAASLPERSSFKGTRSTQQNSTLKSSSQFFTSSTNLRTVGGGSSRLAIGKNHCATTAAVVAVTARVLRPVEERFKIHCEKNISKERMEELGINKWSKWESDKCVFPWEWKVDEEVFIVKGSVQVTPEDCKDSTWFYAGDYVRYPKWFSAQLCFDGPFEQRYRFRAYGED